MTILCQMPTYPTKNNKMTDVFSKQIAIEIEDGRKLAKVPLGKIGEHGWASLLASDLGDSFWAMALIPRRFFN